MITALMEFAWFGNTPSLYENACRANYETAISLMSDKNAER